MLLGSYEHTLDAKNRLTLPSKLRMKLSGMVYVSLGFEGSLELRSEDEFNLWTQALETLEPLKKDARALKRYVFSHSAEVEIDAAGRIKIPTTLLEIAKINKEVLILGVGSKIEIWNKSTYEDYESENLANIEEIAEKVHELGK